MELSSLKRRILLLIMGIVFSSFNIWGQTTETYYKDSKLYITTKEKKAKYKKIETKTDSTSTIRVIDLTTNKEVYNESRLNHLPTGIWTAYNSETGESVSRDFSNSRYLKAFDPIVTHAINDTSNKDLGLILKGGMKTLSDSISSSFSQAKLYPIPISKLYFRKVIFLFTINEDGSPNLIGLVGGSSALNPYLAHDGWKIIEKLKFIPLNKKDSSETTKFLLPISLSM